MSDQFRYLQCSIEIRDSLVCSEPSPTVVFASYIFAFFPVPIIDSVYSLGVINRFIHLIMIHVLLKQYSRNFNTLLILSLYLSVLLYSSLALRDNLILVAFVFFSLAIIRERLFYALLLVLLVFFLKPLLALPAASILLFCSCPYSVRVKILKLRWSIFFSFLVIGLYLAFEDIILLALNAVRLNYFGEDSSSLVVDYVPVTNLLFELLPGFFRFWLEPTVFQATNMFQLLIAFENLIVFLVAAFGLYRNKGLPNSYFSILIWTLAGTILSIVVINEGTLTRYVYPLKVAILIVLYERLTSCTPNFSVSEMR